MKSSARKAPKLTRAEIAAALRRRKANEARAELRELVSMAYELGRKTANREPIPSARLVAHLREVRTIRGAAKTSTRASRYLALLEGTTKGATISELREAFKTTPEAA